MTSGSVEHDQLASTRPDLVVHSTSLVEVGAFATAVCTCGWHSYARRSRPLARREGRDHELLHSAGGVPEQSARG